MSTIEKKLNHQTGRRIARLKDERDEAKLAAARAEKALKDALDDLDLPDGFPITAGSVEIKRSIISGRETFSLAGYKKRYPVTDEMASFVKYGDEYDRYTIKKV